MPAPLAKGLILSISLLIAAGVAVYENPQFREWFDERRRRLSQVLQGAGEAMPLRAMQSQSLPADDLSTREDDSPEAAERRRVARQQILERARTAREWLAARQQRGGGAPPGTYFDDMVDAEGNLKAFDGQAATTGTDAGASSGAGLRNRAGVPEDAGFGSAAAVQAFNSGLNEDEAFELARRASTSTLEGDEQRRETSLSRPLPPAIDVDAASSAHRSDSEALVDLTPTTSQAPSSWHPGAPTPHSPTSTPPIVTPDALSFAGTPPIMTPVTPGTPRSPGHTAVDPTNIETAFRSIHDWARASTASFYSPPESVTAEHPPDSLAERLDLSSDPASSAAASETPSLIGHDDLRPESRSADVMSDFEGSAATPSTWTDVGSVVSDEEHQHQ